jgi:hypothetical protein
MPLLRFSPRVILICAQVPVLEIEATDGFLPNLGAAVNLRLTPKRLATFSALYRLDGFQIFRVRVDQPGPDPRFVKQVALSGLKIYCGDHVRLETLVVMPTSA